MGFRGADFERLASFWNGFAPERYALDAELLQLKTVQCPAFDWGASCVIEADGETLGFAVVKKSARALYRGPDQDVSHLSLIAFCDPNFGVDLLSDVKTTLRNRGSNRLVFGQDSGHFFPGCPTDFGALSDFLMVEGFAEGAEVVDLERDMRDYQNPYQTPADAQMRPVESDADAALVEAFLVREFPGRWTYDVLSKMKREGKDCVFGLFRGGACDGFALLQDWRHREPIGGAVWRSDLGERWGSLGPIGVSKDLRGQGYGHALLGSALSELRERGVHRAIIDWTTLRDFYGKHGFEVSRSYKSLALRLAD
jgi:GNAT superfamily N-acetyltransferase